MRVIANKNASNKHTYQVEKDGTPFDLDLAGVTRIDVVESGKAISSETGEVTFSGSSLTVEWGALDVDGMTNPTIYAYKAGDDKGEVIAGPGMAETVQLMMMADERPQ